MTDQVTNRVTPGESAATDLLGIAQEVPAGVIMNAGSGSMEIQPDFIVPGTKSSGLSQMNKQRVARWIAVLAVLVLWQLSGLFLKPIFISTPTNVFTSFFRLIGDGRLPKAFFQSLLEMIGGVIIAGIVGIGVGLLMGRIRIVERALEPLVAFGNATPSIALLPVMEVWFGIGTKARVAFIMVICTWPLLVNTYAGVKAVRGNFTDVGKAFGLDGWKQTWKVYFPGTIPFIFIGIRIALAVGAVGMILGGQEIGDTGLGGLAETFGSYSQTADLISTIVATTGLALILFALARKIQAWRFPWIADTSAGRRTA
ncbi:MAG: ABC transporter permease [Actinomycetota bacterium]|nr:MAG: ABC transporter permease [Actinomycetota bacterium]